MVEFALPLLFNTGVFAEVRYSFISSQYNCKEIIYLLIYIRYEQTGWTALNQYCLHSNPILSRAETCASRNIRNFDLNFARGMFWTFLMWTCYVYKIPLLLRKKKKWRNEATNSQKLFLRKKTFIKSHESFSKFFLKTYEKKSEIFCNVLITAQSTCPIHKMGTVRWLIQLVDKNNYWKHRNMNNTGFQQCQWNKMNIKKFLDLWGSILKN